MSRFQSEQQMKKFWGPLVHEQTAPNGSHRCSHFAKDLKISEAW